MNKLNQLFSIIGILIVLINIQSVVSQCDSFATGDYSCTFSPNNRYSSLYDSQTFTMTLSGPAGNQRYEVNDNDICSSTVSGTFTVVDSDDVEFSVDDHNYNYACDYLLFNDVNAYVPVKNVNTTGNCNQFSGVAYYSDTLVNKGKLNCQFVTANGGGGSSTTYNNDSSASSIIFSSLLFVWVAFFFF